MSYPLDQSRPSSQVFPAKGKKVVNAAVGAVLTVVAGTWIGAFSSHWFPYDPVGVVNAVS